MCKPFLCICEYEINLNIFIIISGCSGPFIKHWPKDGPWIALIKRGDCTFSQKIKNAESLNASGVLVYDHDSGANLFMKMVFCYHNCSNVL